MFNLCAAVVSVFRPRYLHFNILFHQDSIWLVMYIRILVEKRYTEKRNKIKLKKIYKAMVFAQAKDPVSDSTTSSPGRTPVASNSNMFGYVVDATCLDSVL